MDRHHDRLVRAKDIFADALDLPEAQRTALLDAACGGDPELMAMVNTLLAAHAAADRFMDSPSKAPDVAAARIPTERIDEAGALVGPYRLVEALGEGGFGVVYLAEQTEPVRRRVALKVIKLGMDTRQVIARFEAERQALAMMDHPNIARVLDAGATASGRPYFVMELVPGEPITKHCDANQLSIGARLELFTNVCHAVQHAHQKGIVHRDIKPSNVLVTMVDGQPATKVIDFGIAKALSERLTDKTLFTVQRQLLGTPEYMSPEQAALGEVDIDTRSDIYSLGVLLYELLVGAPPFDPQRLRSASLDDVQRIIREEEPPRPSTRLTTMGDGVATVAARRRTEPARLIAIVRGDLDWIVTKSLEKDRARRYESASALAMDVMRHRTGEPVMAVPPSRSYRLRKFVRRNKGAVVTTGLVAAALVLGLAGTTLGFLKAEHRRVDAEAAGNLADRRAVETARIAEFQAQMLTRINAAEAGARLMREIREAHDSALGRLGIPDAEHQLLTEALDVALARVNGTDVATTFIDRTILSPAVVAVDEQFRDQPAVDAALRQSLADAYWGLGLYDPGIPLQERALTERRQILGDDHADTLASMLKGAQRLSLARSLMGPERLTEAMQLAKEVLDRRGRLLGPSHPDTLAAQVQVGVLLQALGQDADAERACREAVDGLRSAPGHATARIDGLATIGTALASLGRFAEAEPPMREALADSRILWGDDDSRTIMKINDFGEFLFRQRRYSEAEPFLHEAMTRATEAWGADHPTTLGFAWNTAFTLCVMGRSVESERCFRELAERRTRLFGEGNSEANIARRYLASILVDLDRAEEGEREARRAVEASLRRHGAEHQETLEGKADLARSLIAMGKFFEAQELLEEALGACRRALGDDHIVTLRTEIYAGEVLGKLGLPHDAEPRLRAAVEKYAECSGESRSMTIRGRLNLGRVLVALSRFDDAESQLLRAEAWVPVASFSTVETHRECIEALIDLYERWDHAEPRIGHDAAARAWRARLADLAGDSSH